MDKAVKFFGEDALRNAQRVVPLDQVKEPDIREGSRPPQSLNVISLRPAKMRELQTRAIARRFLELAPASAIYVWLLFEMAGWAVRGPLGPPSPGDLFEATWVIAAYLVVAVVVCIAQLLWWYSENSVFIDDGHMVGIYYYGQRTDLYLTPGSYFIPTSAALQWRWCDGHSEIRKTITVTLRPPDCSNIAITYYVRWRVVDLWEYLHAGDFPLISSQICRSTST